MTNEEFKGLTFERRLYYVRAYCFDCTVVLGGGKSGKKERKDCTHCWGLGFEPLPWAEMFNVDVERLYDGDMG